MIESVEKLCAQLHIAAFTQQMKWRPLNNRDVRVILTRAKDNTYATVSETRRATVISDYRPDSGPGCIAQYESLVEVVSQLTLNRAGIYQIVICAAGRELRPIARDPKNVVGVRARQSQWRSRLDGSDSG